MLYNYSFLFVLYIVNFFYVDKHSLKYILLAEEFLIIIITHFLLLGVVDISSCFL